MIRQITLQVDTEKLSDRLKANPEHVHGLGTHIASVCMGDEDFGFRNALGLTLFGIEVVDNHEDL